MPTAEPERPLVGALLGATVVVFSPPDAAAAMESTLGWRRRAEGRLGSGARFATVAALGADRGMVRFLEGPETGPVEDLCRGWASVEVVVRDVDGLAKRLDRSEHFRLRTPPVTFDLTEQGSNVHRACLAWGPGGLLMGFTMAMTQPRGRRFTDVRDEVGPVFSVGLRTPDLDATSAFYQRVLGMEILLEVSWLSGQWHGIFGIPDGEVAGLTLLKGAGKGTGLGTIEVQSFPAHRLGPPAPPGLATVTCQSHDLAATRASAERAGALMEDEDGSFTLVGDQGERLEVTAGTW